MASGHCAFFMCLCLWVCLYDSSPTPKARSFGGIIILLHFPRSPTDLKSVLLVSWHWTENRFYISWLLIIVPNVKFKFNTKEGGPGINFKGHPILTMHCRIWLHFLCSVIDLIGSLGTNEPNTKNRDEPGHFDDIILLYEVLPVPSGEKIVAWCGGNGLSR